MTWKGVGATDLGAERASFAPRPLSFPERACIVLPSFSGFLSPSTRPTLGFIVFDHENFDFVRRSSRERYSLSPPKFVRFHLVYCTRIFEI